MFSFFKKKIVVPHVRLTGVIGAAGRFKQGMDLAGQKEILKSSLVIMEILLKMILSRMLNITWLMKTKLTKA